MVMVMVMVTGPCNPCRAPTEAAQHVLPRPIAGLGATASVSARCFPSSPTADAVLSGGVRARVLTVICTPLQHREVANLDADLARIRASRPTPWQYSYAELSTSRNTDQSGKHCCSPRDGAWRLSLTNMHAACKILEPHTVRRVSLNLEYEPEVGCTLHLARHAFQLLAAGFAPGDARPVWAAMAICYGQSTGPWSAWPWTASLAPAR